MSFISSFHTGIRFYNSLFTLSQPQILLPGFRAQLAGGLMVHRLSPLQDIAVAADFHGEFHILLGNQDRHAFLQQILHHDGQLIHDNGRQAFGDLV